MPTIKLIDFSSCPLSNKNGLYAGQAGRKDGIVYRGENWMVKYPKSTKDMDRVPVPYTTSPLNEFVGSHIYEILGYDVHQTLLGIRNGKLVVACKDFETDNLRLMELRTIKNHANPELSEILDRDFNSTGEQHFVNFDELFLHLQHNSILTEVKGLEERFWDMCTIDLLIGNGDRNNGNWGIVRNIRTGEDRPAPIFDNGGCFTDKADDAKYRRLLDPKTAKASALNFRSSFGREMEPGNPDSLKQMNALGFVEYAMKFEGFRASVIKNIPLIEARILQMKELINSIPESDLGLTIIWPAQRDYFNTMLQLRLDLLLKPVYERLVNDGRSI